jgi:protein-S-isoprenylcysteine O-methyltransferase Ste14
MLISITIILIYLSFVIELLTWPVSSEASTGRLLHSWRSNKTKHNLIYLLVFLFNSFFTLTPLLISLYFLFYNELFQISFLTYIGLILAWLGRLISIRSAYELNKSKLKSLVTDSMFKWSRNPISLGLFITFFGLILVIPHFLMIIGYIIFVLNINYKIGIEEKFLIQRYGRPYHNYVRSTPKYLIL